MSSFVDPSKASTSPPPSMMLRSNALLLTRWKLAVNQSAPYLSVATPNGFRVPAEWTRSLLDAVDV